MRNRINSSLSDNELAEALKLADYKDIVRQLNNFYGQGLQWVQPAHLNG